MAIQTGDVKLIKSQVMLDVPEGGGAPVAAVVVDGTSNSIFPDISELDRAGGRVNLAKVFAGVRTSDVDGYFGLNVIVAEPPADPNVSVTLFTTGEQFDRRDSAASRIESYLARGPAYQGYLFGDHIQGQMRVTLLQRNEASIPSVGTTLVLTKALGLSTEFSQYVRVTDVAVSSRNFTDAQGDFSRTQVILDISDQLQQDFPGFDALRQDSTISYTGKTKTFETIVADAARYYGVVPLEEAASLGDFTVKAEGIYTQLVPSTRTEVPIADARMNQQQVVQAASGGAITTTLTLAFTTSQALYVGGAILPNSLSVSRAGVTVIDKGGLLVSDSVQVGTVDYDNGILTLSTNVFGTTSGAHSVSYEPAVQPVIVSETLGIAVTQEGQRLSYTVTLDPAPLRKTLQVSYRAQGRWYVLTEDGSGAIRGSDSSFGAGTLNYTTGTVSLTLGALPDVESRVILLWGSSAPTRPENLVPNPILGAVKSFEKIVTIGQAIKPGTVTLSWNDGSAKTATDSAGALTGDAIGAVYYGAGRIHFSPNALPAKDTAITLTVSESVQHIGTVGAFTDGGSAWNFSLTAPVKTRSVEISVVGQYDNREYPGTDVVVKESIRVFDDGAGNLQIANFTSNVTVGSINYTTGACSISKSVGGFKSDQPTFSNRVPLGASDPSSYIKQTGYELRNVPLTVLNGAGGASVGRPSWAWWTGNQGDAAMLRYAGSDGATAQSYPFTLDELTYVSRSFTGYTNLPAMSVFYLGADKHDIKSEGIVRNPSPLTGEGTVVGSSSAAGLLLTQWVPGVSPTPVTTRAAQTSPVSGSSSLLVTDSVTFRTAVAPLINGGFSLVGTWQDGTTFNVTANSSGVIATGSAPVGSTPGSYGVFGVVDYEMGIADIRFGRRIPTAMEGDTGVIDVSELGLAGISFLQSKGVQSDTLRYNAVGYAYLPLDPEILGLNPVRLPADGRVPIFRGGTFAVIGHTGSVGPATVSNGQTINCGRDRLSRVRVVGNNGVVINAGYSADLDAGTVTFSDVTGYSQPVTVEHRIEDMTLVRDAQINGQLSFTRPITHNYPVPGSYVSSALVGGDIRARTSLVFDQVTWTNVWSDSQIGSAATGTFNDAQDPITVTNSGALTERWACVFTSSTAFNVIGEHVGVIATGNTGSDCAPNNPATGEPYFTIPSAGWGLGWATGNVLRFNTVAAMVPVWVARTILQGPETVTDDSFTLLIRGDVDHP